MELIFKIFFGTFVGLTIVGVLICLLGMKTVVFNPHN